MEFNCTKRKLHNGSVNYHLFGLYGLFFSYPWLPLNHLGFLCLSTFMLKELLAKRKFTLGLPRFEPTTMQCQLNVRSFNQFIFHANKYNSNIILLHRMITYI